MATQLFFRSYTGDSTLHPGLHWGHNMTDVAGTARNFWAEQILATARGSGATSANVATVAGPTAGVQYDGSTYIDWLTPPVDADFTLSGTITLNLWGAESNMSANVAINALIERVDSQGAIASTIAQTARTVEMAVTTPGVNNFTVTPTSTNMLKGDRIRVRVYGDDSTANMGSGFTFTFRHAGPTAAVDGDSYISFTETFGFLGTEPAGSTYYLRDAAGPAVGANVEKLMATAKGTSEATAIRNTTAGYTAPLQWTETAGGTAIEWYTPQLEAFTLSDLVRVNLRVAESSALATAGVRAELAVVDDDGTLDTVWAAADLVDMTGPPGTGAGGTGTDRWGELTLASTTPSLSVYGEDHHATNYSTPNNIVVVGTYAYITAGGVDGVTVVDVSDPANPTFVTTLTSGTLFNNVNGIAWDGGDYLFVGAFDTVSKLHTIDISDRTSPSLVNTEADAGAGTPPTIQASANFVYDSGYLYMTVASLADGDGLSIWDVSDPLAPVVAGTVYDALSDGGGEITKIGNHVYSAHFTANRVISWDVTTPSAPTLADSFDDATNLSGVTGLGTDGTWLYCAVQTGDRLTILDVSTPTAISLEGSVTNATSLNAAVRVVVGGNFAYVTCVADRVTVVNVTTKTAPTVSSSLLDAVNLNSPEGIVLDGDLLYVLATASVVGLTVLSGLTGSEPIVRGYIAGGDFSVTQGQRLRLRVFVDDALTGLVTGHTCSLFYNGSVLGDSNIRLSQSVTEFVEASPVSPPARNHQPRQLVFR